MPKQQEIPAGAEVWVMRATYREIPAGAEVWAMRATYREIPAGAEVWAMRATYLGTRKKSRNVLKGGLGMAVCVLPTMTTRMTLQPARKAIFSI
jgi:hypothetical protein